VGVTRPKCERKGGGKPHAATMMVAWELSSGRTWRYSCDTHAETFGGPKYVAARLEGVVDNHSNRQPLHPINSPFPPAAVLAEIPRHGNSVSDAEPIASPDVPVDGRLGSDDKPFSEATCVDPECGNTAPYKGAWCDSCQSKWEDEQRAKAAAAVAEGRPRAINRRRGF